MRSAYRSPPTAYRLRAAVLCCGLLAVSLVLAAPPVVTNVWFSQRQNSSIVDVWYDVSDPDGDPDLAVGVQFSSDGGQTWPIVPRTTSGDIGPGQNAGAKKRIIWDAGKDYASLKGTFVARVMTDDGVTPPPARRSTQEARSGEQGTPAGMQFLRKNRQGYDELLWLKDSSVIIRIPAGTFTMGSNDGEADEKPVHQVFLDGYYIDKCEVTNRQYRVFCDATGKSHPSEFLGMPNYFSSYPDYPVVNVSWDDAQAYCTWVGKQLPTEAEWERAARGTDSREYPWGNSGPTGRTCNFADQNTDYSWSDKNWNDGYARTAPVGTYADGASPYGCMDMAGNVWEWCNDWYGDKCYSSSSSNNPSGPSSGSFRVHRGGSWYLGAGYLRCALRIWYGPSPALTCLGFRCAVTR